VNHIKVRGGQLAVPLVDDNNGSHSATPEKVVCGRESFDGSNKFSPRPETDYCIQTFEAQREFRNMRAVRYLSVPLLMWMFG